MGAIVTAKETHPWRALGHRIAAARDAQHLSQREAAPLLRVAQGYLPAIESGRRRPDPDVLRRIADVFHLDYTELAVLARYADVPPGPYAPEDRWWLSLPTEHKTGIRDWYDKARGLFVQNVPQQDRGSERPDNAAGQDTEE